jgi:hypothetical protein
MQKAQGQLPRIVFSVPEGREQVDPSADSLRELVLRRGDDFWAAGSGQAALEFKGSEGGSRLLLMGLEKVGFFLIHEASTGDSLCSVNPSPEANEQDSVTIYVGGEPMEVPRRNFLDKETAWPVIATFLLDGRPSPQVKWDLWL